jgi:hypothetical protein
MPLNEWAYTSLRKNCVGVNGEKYLSGRYLVAQYATGKV